MITAEVYKFFYLIISGFISLSIIIYSLCNVDFFKGKKLIVPYFLGIILYFILFYFIAFRPVSEVFGDMVTYYSHFEAYKYSNEIRDKDVFFEIILFYFSKNLTSELFFLFCSVLYFFPLYFVYKKIFKDYWPVVFCLNTLIVTFYGFAVNGIRNGIAAHIFLLVFVVPKPIRFIVLILSFCFHSSMILPISAYILVNYIKKINIYYLIWFLSFLISLIYPDFGKLIQSLGLFNDRLDVYVNAGDNFNDQFSKSGYRYDFVIYSFFCILFSAYYIFNRKINDKFYFKITSIYLLCNSFFVLLNQIAFSNRFAYLSWFLIAIIIFYPIYCFREIKDKNILVLSFIFLMVTNIIVNF